MNTRLFALLALLSVARGSAPLVSVTDYAGTSTCPAATGGTTTNSQWFADGTCQPVGTQFAYKGTVSGNQVSFFYWLNSNTCQGQADYGPTTCTAGTCCALNSNSTGATADYQRLGWSGAVAGSSSVVPSWAVLVSVMLLLLARAP